ncbi:hypothetical protein CDL15_Pgr011833 [Punica granatum]|uniref:Uncharacterized protein n=1 Tax=Punica granatum TaxID=22663 RepID=A0A218XF91_PUNGR|nr:hypothetical protein CDL15_Pgr011833 [Punica granatum]
MIVGCLCSSSKAHHATINLSFFFLLCNILMLIPCNLTFSAFLLQPACSELRSQLLSLSLENQQSHHHSQLWDLLFNTQQWQHQQRRGPSLFFSGSRLVSPHLHRSPSDHVLTFYRPFT